MDEDESLEAWAARRDARRRPVGALKVVVLGHEDAAGHRYPKEPRLVSRWDGYQWIPETVAPDYAAAQRLLHGVEGDGVVPMAPAQPREKPRGRHRKP
ncbi:DUF6087 family protein [Kitasatospora brasiliensis]|uniref:DUF6087 family protein n=1 Tax=Kitasatospora brasiliensis TaxID=3058040 RepID=UPI00292D0AF5|nr:DUF6087 family protein [Kitasatospora sp. K002]